MFCLHRPGQTAHAIKLVDAFGRRARQLDQNIILHQRARRNILPGFGLRAVSILIDSDWGPSNFVEHEYPEERRPAFRNHA